MGSLPRAQQRRAGGGALATDGLTAVLILRSPRMAAAHFLLQPPSRWRASPVAPARAAAGHHSLFPAAGGRCHSPGNAELVNPAGIVIAGRSFRRLRGLRDRRVNP
jgi:hypothetical protein